MAFNLDNYEEARTLANQMKQHAQNIHDSFEDEDSIMCTFNSSSWISKGSDDSYSEYLNEFKAHYEPFYQEICDRYQQVIDDTNIYEAADVAADNAISG